MQRRGAWFALSIMALIALADATRPGAAHAETSAKTLASIRQELNGLYSLVRGLQQEIKAPPAKPEAVDLSGSTQERLDAIEARLEQLTNDTEELQHRIKQVIADATNRIGDLNYRLCDLEKGCDITKIGKTPVLGGADVKPAPVTAPAPGQPQEAPDLAVGEKPDFEKAKAALDAGKYQDAADQFASFTETYTAGPLTGQAHYYRGWALEQMGQTADAARAYLDSFSGSPDGVRAPDALTRLGINLGKLGQVQEACVTLGQVSVRYPDSSAVADADKARQNLGCQ
ncbi:tol-pal system protein YbgF [Acidimangrovimonas pyrenivorans]|uniref:Cell division coordinator CpoB n=1 Tax=Acidimangrovimonas pyrenivorans TaxID=2030798 RepID=A0ABV7AB23_9RHOB